MDSMNNSENVVTPKKENESNFVSNNSKLAEILCLVGVVNVLASFFIGIALAEDFSWVISIAVIISGCFGCLFWIVLAKFVDAADKYLNSH